MLKTIFKLKINQIKKRVLLKKIVIRQQKLRARRGNMKREKILKAEIMILKLQDLTKKVQSNPRINLKNQM